MGDVVGLLVGICSDGGAVGAVEDVGLRLGGIVSVGLPVGERVLKFRVVGRQSVSVRYYICKER